MATAAEVDSLKEMLRKQIAITDMKSAEIERLMAANFDGVERAKTAEATVDGLKWEVEELRALIKDLIRLPSSHSFACYDCKYDNWEDCRDGCKLLERARMLGIEANWEIENEQAGEGVHRG